MGDERREWALHPTRAEVKAFGTGYDSWWPGEFAARVMASVERYGVALVFAGDGSPHRDGVLCTREMVVDFDAKFNDRGELMPLSAVIEKRCVLGFRSAKTTFTAEKVAGTELRRYVVGPVAEMLESQSGGALALDEECGRFSLQSVSKSPKIAFTSAKAMFDMVE